MLSYVWGRYQGVILWHEPCNNVLVLPSNFVAQTSDGTVFPSRLQSQYTERLWHHHSLLLIVWRRDTLKYLETLHCSGSAGSFVWDHTADGFVEDSGGSAEMEGTFMDS